jgi:uncharacterized protein (DUF427 family)
VTTARRDVKAEAMTGYPKALVPVDHVEPVPRRVRAELGGRVVLDTVGALYLWEWPYYPQFQIPVQDVDPRTGQFRAPMSCAPTWRGPMIS